MVTGPLSNLPAAGAIPVITSFRQQRGLRCPAHGCLLCFLFLLPGTFSKVNTSPGEPYLEAGGCELLLTSLAHEPSIPPRTTVLRVGRAEWKRGLWESFCLSEPLEHLTVCSDSLPNWELRNFKQEKEKALRGRAIPYLVSVFLPVKADGVVKGPNLFSLLL